jgi:acylpyruvate hydrolase
MRLVSFAGGFGRVEGDEIVVMGDDLLTYLNDGTVEERGARPRDGMKLLAPIPRPGKIIGVGLNYRDHARESGQAVPQEPALFAKFANSVIGPQDPIQIPPGVREVDYEAELGVVIGRKARRVTADAALDHLAGYVCVNDVSSRAYQFSTGQWLRGKAIDTFLPIGPELVTADEVGDPQILSIRCIVSGEVLQDSNTREMIFSVAELVSFLSQTICLEPGDLISSGTPHGVGFVRMPPRFLRSGDEVTVEIERVGSLTNPVQAS